MKLRHLKQRVDAITLNQLCRAQSVVAECERHPISRAVMWASATVTFTGLLLCDMARADGFADMLGHAADQSASGGQSVYRIGEFAGIVAVCYGGWNWFKKGQGGQHSDIKAGQIWIPMIAGAVLGSAAYMKRKAGETIGISSSNQGSTTP